MIALLVFIVIGICIYTGMLALAKSAKDADIQIKQMLKDEIETIKENNN